MNRIFKLGPCVRAVVILVAAALPLAAAPDAAAQASLSEVYGKLPLSFEANEGQVDKAVRFLCRGRGTTLFLTPTEAVLSLSGQGHETTVVRMQLDGGNDNPRVVGVDPQETRSNYFLGNDPSQWHTGVAHYAKVRVEDVYPGVALIYRGNQQQLEYDLVVAPGTDPGRIRLAFRGSDAIAIGAQGELILHTASGDLVQLAPTAYQEAGERRQRVEGHYVVLAPPAVKGGGEGAHHQVGFAVGRYDRARPLIIDPVLVYSTFLGGSGNDRGVGIAVDGTGSAYVTGFTSSTTFPGVTAGSIQPANSGGPFDAFVTKINATGSAIVYSTFLGGSGDDVGQGIAVDGSGNAYITGFTSSTTFPGVTAGSIQPTNGGGSYDTFVTKINAAGSAIVYSTFLGGGGIDVGTRIAVDGTESAYVTGYTDSTTFPGVTAGSIQPANGGGFGDAFVTKINAPGTAIIYSTFLGGTASDGGGDIAVDGSGNAHITGNTASTTFPGVTGSSIQPVNGGGNNDAFVTKINAAGSAILYSTFLGVSGDDVGQGIAVDGSGNAYVTGYAFSTTFPGVTAGSIQPANGGARDAFVTKLNAAASAILYSTFLGGSGDDYGFGIAVDGAGNAYVMGVTGSTTFPGVSGSSIQPAYGGGTFDAFVTKINAAGSAIVYSTFLGGSAQDEGHGIAVDGFGNAYVTGLTGSTTFPGVTGSSIQPTNGGGPFDAFVTKIGQPLRPQRLVLSATQDSFLRSGSPNTNEGAIQELRVQSSGKNRVVVGFDLAGVPIVGLVRATLVLRISDIADNWGTAGRTISAHRLLAPWSEGNGWTVGGNTRGDGPGVTWACGTDTQISDQSAECDGSDWAGGVFAAPAGPGALHTNGMSGEVTWDVTADVTSGAPYGWILVKDIESQSGKVFYYSRDAAAVLGDATLAPRLVLEYQ